MRKIGIGLAFLAITVSNVAMASSFDLTAYRGKVVYLDFWASWCGPCKQSFPWLSEMEHQFKSRDFVVVAVNVDHDHERALNFLSEFSAEFPIIYDPAGTIATEYKVSGMPSAVLIDRTGHIRYQHAGFSTKKKDQYEEHIETLLSEPVQRGNN